MSNTVEGVVDGGFWMNKQNDNGDINKGVFMGVLIGCAPNRGAIVIATNTFSQ